MPSRSDYDLHMDRDPSALFCLGQNAQRGIATFHLPCLTERAWTKRELADALNATDAMMDSVQIYGGLVVVRKTAFALRFVREWLRWSNSDLVTDAARSAIQHRTFVQHRHDQSILSLLSKRHMIKSFPFPTRAHDIRDVWAWDAGYCAKRGFDWPLPTFRSNLFCKARTQRLKPFSFDELRHSFRAPLVSLLSLSLVPPCCVLLVIVVATRAHRGLCDAL